MMNSRESIYNALALQLKTIAGLNTVSRVYRPITDYANPAQLPAGCLDETDESAAVPEHGLAALYTLSIDFWLYFPAPQLSQTPGQEQTIPMTALNNALDALDVALPNPQSPVANYNTLGGLVQHVWIEGKILKVAGVASGNAPFSVARVPIKLLAI